MRIAVLIQRASLVTAVAGAGMAVRGAEAAAEVARAYWQGVAQCCSEHWRMPVVVASAALQWACDPQLVALPPACRQASQQVQL
jgi:hypothetical protein